MILPMDWLFDIPVAHRGLHDAENGVPENSLAAFDAARREGYPIELDVRILRDGGVVVFHDESLERMTGGPTMLEGEDSETIRTYRLAGTDETIPFLTEVFDVVRGKVPVLIELKNFGVPGQLEAAVHSALQSYNGRCAVQSFNPFSMGWFKVNAPQITRGHLSGGFVGVPLEEDLKETLRSLELIDVSAPAFVGFDVRFLPFDPVSELRSRGMPILGWTVRSHQEQRHALQWCDNYIFELIDPRSNANDT
jgi:glycerophosphoryl diester phosphodiesterase